MLADLPVDIDGVIALDVEPEELIQRLLQRAAVDGRADDTESVIRRRQEIYQEQTAPLIEEYDGRGLLAKVDGTGRIDHVTDRILTAVARLQTTRK